MRLEARITRHVNRLFAHAQDTLDNRELKEEIHSNLAARIDDYISQGMSEEKAFQTAIQHIAGMDEVMSDHRRVQRVPYWTALLQSALIYSLVAWIITIPMRVLMQGSAINNLLMIVSLIVGGMYVLYLLINKTNDSATSVKTTVIRIPALVQWNRRIWWLWAALILVLWGTQAALRFGSNIWFNRPIQVDGPYQFAVIVIAFAIPLLSVIIPLVVHRAYRIVSKYEVSDAL
ncbi:MULTISPECIES: permease prefix domain 1-containing protein [unclassified Paenibacillus]|uniref:permease prefix domain 1-containing protein n=1 Tax=unclassified Paenibacillus TaxID=185978 RepID=UPI0030CC3E70